MKVKITKALTKRRKKSRKTGDTSVIMLEERRKRADVIIPVYRPDEKLKQLLEGLRKQTHLAEHIFLIRNLPQKKPEKPSAGHEIPSCQREHI